jgi:N-acetylglutamate synthase
MIKEIEELSMNAWPALQTKLYDGWIVRFADGYTKRSNSVSPIYASSRPIDEKIDFCEKEYKDFNLPAIFKLTADSTPEGIDRRLEERGYARCDETSVRILEMDRYTYAKPEGMLIEKGMSEGWFEGYLSCTGGMDQKFQAAARRVLGNILGEVVCVSKQVDGKTVGCGFGAIERGYIGIYDINVDKNYRRKGYGQDIMDAILGTALEQNVKTAYLSVVVGNLPAERLYERIGFKEIYRYWYRVK